MEGVEGWLAKVEFVSAGLTNSDDLLVEVETKDDLFVDVAATDDRVDGEIQEDLFDLVVSVLADLVESLVGDVVEGTLEWKGEKTDPSTRLAFSLVASFLSSTRYFESFLGAFTGCGRRS